MSVDWLAVRSTLKGLQDAPCITGSILNAAYPDIDAITQRASEVASTCSPSLASELVDKVYGALINVFANLGSASCRFTQLDSVAQQSVVRLICTPGLCFTGTIQGTPRAFPAHLARLDKSGTVSAWVDVSERLAAELHRLQQTQTQDQGSVTALDVAGALLTFWVPLIGMCKDFGGLSVCEPTLLTAAKLAAAVLHMWPCTRSTPTSTSEQRYAEIVRVKATQAALDAGNALASILNPAAVPAPLQDIPAGLLTSDAVLHILCSNLAYKTLVLHQRSRGAAAVKLAASSSSRKNPATAVPGHHTALFTALGLGGYTDVEEDQAASPQTINGSCRALTLVLQQRFHKCQQHQQQQQQQEQQGEVIALPEQLCSLLLHAGIEQLLLLGAADPACVFAITVLLQHVMWLGLPVQMPSSDATAAVAAANEHLRKDTLLKLLLQVGPVVLAAVKEGSTQGLAPAQIEASRFCMMKSLFRLYRLATTGVVVGPAFQIAPLTVGTVLEAVVRSQGWQQQSAAGPGSTPIMLGMIMQVVASMGESAADRDLASFSAAAEANAAAAQGVLLVQVPAGALNPHAPYCLLFSCLKYAAAVCSQRQYRWEGISVAAAVAKVIHFGTEGVGSTPAMASCSGSSCESANSSSKKWEVSVKLLTILAARCLQLLAVLLDSSQEAEGSSITSQQQQSDVAAAMLPSASDITLSIKICTDWLQEVLRLHSELLHWPSEVRTSLESKVALALASLKGDSQQQQQPTAAAAPQHQTHLDRLHQMSSAVPVDALGPWREVAEAVQDQLPVRFCCNNQGCTRLEGLGEKGSVAGKVCTKCKMARYCSVACQQAAWPRHRRVCKRIRQGA